jgi:hypothetical protein
MCSNRDMTQKQPTRFSEGGVEETSDGDWISDHALSLRRALQYCQEQMEWDNARKDGYNTDSDLHTHRLSFREEFRGTDHREEVRNHAQENFWKQHCGSFRNAGTSPTIDVVHADEITPLEFIKHYQLKNIPCMIYGLDKTCFKQVSEQWGGKRGCSNGDRCSKCCSFISRDWFHNVVGSRTLVPVKYQPAFSHGSEANGLDEDGRATECATKQMPLEEYLQLLNDNTTSHCQGKEESYARSSFCSYYLKDWHLQTWLETNHPALHPLYEVPELFETDVLNRFLTRFTAGDYRFVYWGPVASVTTPHADVLNSFSWSFNVRGVKIWTFYPPSCLPNFQGRELRVRQEMGTCVFVPAGWKHEVFNEEETISINHNWITSANVDLTWTVVRQELEAVEQELRAWGIDDWEARESMLRGCIGLDVSSFCFMILCRLVELRQNKSELADDHLAALEISSLRSALFVVLEDDSQLIELQARFAASFASTELGCIAINMVKQMISGKKTTEQ